ncbi:MAG: hypothetical protein P8Y58_04825 [Novosphingobium sp.]
MVAAEARASGVPVIVPDAGGALDHAADGAGRSFEACDPASAAQAIREVAIARPRPVAKARSMDEHFADLFATYAATAQRPLQAA